MRWLIEQLLRPDRIEPDPEPLQRGSLAHAVLERTLALLRERTGSARRSCPSASSAALAALRDALAERVAAAAAARGARALLRGLEADLERYLRTRGGARRGLRAGGAGVVVRRRATIRTGRCRSARAAAR